MKGKKKVVGLRTLRKERRQELIKYLIAQGLTRRRIKEYLDLSNKENGTDYDTSMTIIDRDMSEIKESIARMTDKDKEPFRRVLSDFLITNDETYYGH